MSGLPRLSRKLTPSRFGVVRPSRSSEHRAGTSWRAIWASGLRSSWSASREMGRENRWLPST